MGPIVLKFCIQCYISSLNTFISTKLENEKIDFFKHKMIVNFSEKVTFYHVRGGWQKYLFLPKKDGYVIKTQEFITKTSYLSNDNSFKFISTWNWYIFTEIYKQPLWCLYSNVIFTKTIVKLKKLLPRHFNLTYFLLILIEKSVICAKLKEKYKIEIWVQKCYFSQIKFFT